jgi:hypothetical protein
MSAPDIDYICVGICRVDPESGSCLGCGRPPPDENPAVPAEPSRYPLAVEYVPDLPQSGGQA